MGNSTRQNHSPSSDPTLDWALSSAAGYLQLGMLAEAGREMTLLGLEDQTKPEVLELRIRILIARKQCDKAAELARIATRLYPRLIDFYILSASAYEKKGNLEKAKEIWLSVPFPFQDSGFLHYKIARCENKLGNYLSARKHLDEAIKTDGDINQDLIGYPEMEDTPQDWQN